MKLRGRGRQGRGGLTTAHWVYGGWSRGWREMCLTGIKRTLTLSQTNKITIIINYVGNACTVHSYMYIYMYILTLYIQSV